MSILGPKSCFRLDIRGGNSIYQEYGGNMKRIIIILLGIGILAAGMTAFGQSKKRSPIERMFDLNDTVYFYYVDTPGFGSLHMLHRDQRERTLQKLINVYNELKENKLPGFFRNPGSPPTVARDKLKIDKNMDFKKGKSKISLSFLYEIRDSFFRLRPPFKIGFDIFFVLPNSIKRGKKHYNGINRLNKEKWYDLVTASKFDIAVDLGKNRVLGFVHDQPLRLYGFNWSFGDDFHVNLPDFRLRQELYKLTHNKFIFHNFRLSPNDYAVEIYDTRGRRLAECFDYAPHNIIFKPPHKAAMAARTVMTTDRRGHFYIGFAFAQNPYRIWKYNENGEKVGVTGNYFEDPEVYQFPDEWILGSTKDLRYYGLRRLYTIERLLTDVDGRLYVFFTMNRDIRKRFALNPRGEKAKVKKHYLDIYSPDGEFMGRKEFKYGFPELIDNGIIYSRISEEGYKWGLTAVRIDIQ